jgi:hypothetical protein
VHARTDNTALSAHDFCAPIAKSTAARFVK